MALGAHVNCDMQNSTSYSVQFVGGRGVIVRTPWPVQRPSTRFGDPPQENRPDDGGCVESRGREGENANNQSVGPGPTGNLFSQARRGQARPQLELASWLQLTSVQHLHCHSATP